MAIITSDAGKGVPSGCRLPFTLGEKTCETRFEHQSCCNDFAATSAGSRCRKDECAPDRRPAGTARVIQVQGKNYVGASANHRRNASRGINSFCLSPEPMQHLRRSSPHPRLPSPGHSSARGSRQICLGNKKLDFSQVFAGLFRDGLSRVPLPSGRTPRPFVARVPRGPIALNPARARDRLQQSQVALAQRPKDPCRKARILLRATQTLRPHGLIPPR